MNATLLEPPLIQFTTVSPRTVEPEPPTFRRKADRIPCSFRTRELAPRQWIVARRAYDAAAVWRSELGSDNLSLRFNRRVLAGFLRVYRLTAPIPGYVKAAARAGMERVLWDISGKVVNLRRRPAPLRPTDPPAAGKIVAMPRPSGPDEFPFFLTGLKAAA